MENKSARATQAGSLTHIRNEAFDPDMEAVGDARARVTRALEALRDGERDFADQLLDDLAADLWRFNEAIERVSEVTEEGARQ